MNSHFKLKNNIKGLRKSYGITQTQLAKAVGCSQNTISSLENYEYFPSAYLAYLICKAFGCHFEECFFIDD